MTPPSLILSLLFEGRTPGNTFGHLWFLVSSIFGTFTDDYRVPSSYLGFFRDSNSQLFGDYSIYLLGINDYLDDYLGKKK